MWEEKKRMGIIVSDDPNNRVFLTPDQTIVQGQVTGFVRKDKSSRSLNKVKVKKVEKIES